MTDIAHLGISDMIMTLLSHLHKQKYKIKLQFVAILTVATKLY